MCIMGKLEEDRETEEIFEVIKAENFPTFMTDTKPQLQEAQRTSSMINQKKKSTSKHIMFKLKKNQRQRKHGRAGVEEITYRGIRLRMTSDFSSEIMKARRE